MKSQITSAFDDNAKHFDLLIRSIASKYQPLWIFCFAKNVSIQVVHGNFRESDLKCIGDYCLLIITESGTRIEHEVQDFANHIYRQGKITVLCHGKENVFNAIAKNNRFYITVFTSSDLHYSHDGINHRWYELSHDATLLASKAEMRMRYHLSHADAFLASANTCLLGEQYNVGTFMLHQAVEQCCIALIRIFLSYRSDVHNVIRLLTLCTSFSDAPYNWFVTGRRNDQKLLEILSNGYSQARYGKEVAVDEIDAKCLYEKVSAFLIIARDMCTQKVVEFQECIAQLEDGEVQND